MELTRNILILIVAALHFYFLALEMFFWTKPLGLKTFRQSHAQAQASAALAANQGLYNGFLAAGLLWSFAGTSAEASYQMRCFILVCVFVAGVYGARTVNHRIFFVQSLPAALALALTRLVGHVV